MKPDRWDIISLALGGTFIALKLVGLVSWPWWIVLAPLWVVPAWTLFWSVALFAFGLWYCSRY